MFDDKAKETISNLKSLLKIEVEEKPSLTSIFPIGAEIEVKFRYYFPEIFVKYFEGKKWYEYSDDDKTLISNLISEEEKYLLPLLEATVTAGIPRGNDRYWEFSFTPVNDLTLLYYQIEILKNANLIPKGEHSFHLTIGGIKPNKKIYHVLMVLDLLFLKKERILSGYDFNKNINGTWAKKGRAGVLIKNSNDLIDANEGTEFRTLCIYDDTDVYLLLKTLHHLLYGDSQDLINKVLNKMNSYNLPDKNWENIHKNFDIWLRYSEKFDTLADYTKEIYETGYTKNCEI